jgi:hypothetical protein
VMSRRCARSTGAIPGWRTRSPSRRCDAGPVRSGASRRVRGIRYTARRWCLVRSLPS